MLSEDVLPSYHGNGFVFVLKRFQDKCICDWNRNCFQCNRNWLDCDFVYSES